MPKEAVLALGLCLLSGARALGEESAVASPRSPQPGESIQVEQLEPAPGVRALEAMQRGRQQYNLGRFEEALAAFSRAYEAEPAPRVLIEIGRCHRQLKNYERALFFFESYLRESPATRARDDDELLKVEADRLRQETRGLADDSERLAQAMHPTLAAPTTARPRDQRTDSVPVAVATPIAPPPAAPKKPIYEEPWLWGAAGGTALVVVATVIAVVALAPTQTSGSIGVFDLREAN